MNRIVFSSLCYALPVSAPDKHMTPMPTSKHQRLDLGRYLIGLHCVPMHIDVDRLCMDAPVYSMRGREQIELTTSTESTLLCDVANPRNILSASVFWPMPSLASAPMPYQSSKSPQHSPM